MSPSPRHGRDPSAQGQPNYEQKVAALAPGDLLDLLDDEHVQMILEQTASEPKRARELADASNASRATVYRRLNRLEDAGLLTSRMAYDAEGHHHQVFRTTLEAATISLTDGLHVETSISRPDTETADAEIAVPSD